MTKKYRSSPEFLRFFFAKTYENPQEREVMKTFVALGIVLALLAVSQVVAVGFTEIMYDPYGDDNNKEFLEVQGATNLSKWVITDAVSNDTLVPLQETGSDYSLIVEEGFNYTGLSCNIYSAGATIGNNLNNDKDNVTLYDRQGALVARASYSFGFGGANNNHTLEFVDKLWVEDASGQKVSDVASFRALKRFTGYETTLSVRLKDSTKYRSGEYQVVVEGIDERDEAALDISQKEAVAASSTTTASGNTAQNPSCARTVDERKTFTIDSFYTRSTKTASNIKLFATVKGEGNVTLSLVGLLDHQSTGETLNGSYAYSANATLQPGPNLFILKLNDSKRMVAERSLLLEVENDTIKEVEWFSLTPRLLNTGIDAATSGQRGVQKISVGKNATNSSSALSGAVVAYNADRTVRLLPLLLGLIGLLLFGLVLQHRKS
jgi:hypothetical protein